MSLVSTGFWVSIQLIDEAGNRSSMRFQLTAATIGDAQTDAATIVGDLTPVTTALVSGYSVGQSYEEDTEIYGEAGSEVENIANVVCRLENAAIKYHTMKIPAPAIGIFQGTSGPDKNKVDRTDTQLNDWLLNFTDRTGFSSAGPDALALVSDGEKLLGADPLVEISAGKRVHRRSTKG